MPGQSIILRVALFFAAAVVAVPQTPSAVPAAEKYLVASDYQPLTNGERSRRYFADTLLSPGLYLASAGTALVSQLNHDPPEWRQGAEGYFRRSASSLGVFAIRETIAQGGDALLGYEPRYFHCECSGFLRRSGHAILWTFITENKAGAKRFDVPMLAGAYGSGMISMLWYPARYEPLSDGVRSGSQQVGFKVGWNLIREFSPEAKRIFHLH